jgi:hypothetical protein
MALQSGHESDRGCVGSYRAPLTLSSPRRARQATHRSILVAAARLLQNLLANVRQQVVVALLNPLQDVYAVLASAKGLQDVPKVTKSADRACAAAAAETGTLSKSCIKRVRVSKAHLSRRSASLGGCCRGRDRVAFSESTKRCRQRQQAQGERPRCAHFGLRLQVEASFNAPRPKLELGARHHRNTARSNLY